MRGFCSVENTSWFTTDSCDRDRHADLGCGSLFQFPTHLSLKRQVCLGPAADMTRRQSPDFLCKTRPPAPNPLEITKKEPDAVGSAFGPHSEMEVNRDGVNSTQ